MLEVGTVSSPSNPPPVDPLSAILQSSTCPSGLQRSARLKAAKRYVHACSIVLQPDSRTSHCCKLLAAVEELKRLLSEATDAVQRLNSGVEKHRDAIQSLQRQGSELQRHFSPAPGAFSDPGGWVRSIPRPFKLLDLALFPVWCYCTPRAVRTYRLTCTLMCTDTAAQQQAMAPDFWCSPRKHAFVSDISLIIFKSI